MKKFKTIFAATAVVAIVAGALSFKKFGEPNLLFCSPTSHTCVFPTTAYSTVNNGDVIAYPDFTLYQEGTQRGNACSATSPCLNPIPTTQTIYNNN
jgi:hypothetical protein